MSGAKIMQSMNQYSMIERSDHLVDRGWRTSYSSSASSGGKASAAAAISAQAESNSNLTPQKPTPADIRYDPWIFTDYTNQGAFATSEKPHPEYKSSYGYSSAFPDHGHAGNALDE